MGAKSFAERGYRVRIAPMENCRGYLISRLPGKYRWFLPAKVLMMPSGGIVSATRLG